MRLLELAEDPTYSTHQVFEEPFPLIFYLAIFSRSSSLNNSWEYFGVSWAWITVPFPMLPHHLVHYYCSPARLKSSKHRSYTPWPLQSLSSGLEHNLGEGDKRLTSLMLANFLRSFSVKLLPPTAKGWHCSSLTIQHLTRLNTLKVTGTQFWEQFILEKWKSLGI